MIVRVATAEDEPDVLRLARAFLTSGLFPFLEAASDRQLRFLFSQVLEHGAVFLAGDPPVGFLVLYLGPHPITGECTADELAWWVMPEARGSSAGARLMAAAEEWARVRHASCLRMVAPVGSPEVGRFYTRRGYEPIEVSYMLRF